MATTIHLIDSLQTGGAQTHLVTMLAQISPASRKDHRVLSLFGDGPIGDRIRELGIPVDVFDLRPMLSSRGFLTAAEMVADYCRRYQPDIVEAHLTFSRLIGLFAAWRARVSVRIAFEQGDIYLNSWKFRLANFAGQVFADRIVVCSHALARWNRRTNGFSRKRMVILHNCVDTGRFDPSTTDVTSRPFARPPCRTLFCSVGTLGSGVNKRVDVAIRAIATAREIGADVGLVIVGDGAQRPDLEQLTRELRVQEQVLFLGTRSDLPAILNSCEAFCHAAEFEPFGIVCIEAMAMKLPVVVPDSGGIGEAVDEGVTGFVYPVLDHDALAEKMVILDRGPELRKKMGQNGRAAVEERFTATAYMERLESLYAGLLARKQT